MNLLKNMLIIAILAAAGYGIYSSLARNNVDPSPPPGVAPGWPSAPKVELSMGKSTPSAGGPLALSGTTVRPAPPSAAGSVGSAPPFASPSSNAGSPSTTPPAPPPLMPYPSASSPAVAVAAVSANPSATPPAASMVTLGPPASLQGTAATPSVDPTVRPETPAVASEGVCNLCGPPDGGSDAGLGSPVANPAERLLQSKFAAFMEEVQKSLDQRKFADAHRALSTLYGSSALPTEQAKQITELLDQLAGTVIYSREHHLEPAYVTQQGDTLERVAQKYNVPWQVLGRINGLMPPAASNTDESTKDLPLQVGMELKVVRGPFEAVVHLDRRELTLMLQDRYAGRFAIGIGRDQPQLDGSYMVREKALHPSYNGPDGVNIGAGDPRNPLGGAWIGLNDGIGIHGTNDPRGIGRDDNRGTICVSDHDLQDLYGILSVGSRVTVMR